jgi:Barstar (barnase inhibitor)
LRRAQTLSEFHYNRVFIDATALTSDARVHAELRFKLGLPSDYAANWDAFVECLSFIGDPDAHLCRYWEYTPTKRLVLSVRGFTSADVDPTLLVSLAAAVASANDHLRQTDADNRVWMEFAVDPNG